MAQTKKKRKTKHRGTPTGSIDTRGRTSRPRSRTEARQQAAQRRQQARVARTAQPPTWSGALKKAGIAGVIFLAVVLAFSKDASPIGVIALALIMFGIYVPMSYYFDGFIYQRQQRTEAERRANPKGE